MANIETITVGNTTFPVATTPTNMEYSTTEKVVGTWVDGKPIYQKTFIGTAVANSSTTIGTLSNLNDLISIVGAIHYSSNGYVPLSYLASGSDYASLYVSNGNIIVMGKYGGRTIITVKYTKTTD